MQGAAPNFILSMLGRRSLPSINGSASINYQNQRRTTLPKPPNKAGLHGSTQLPPTHTLDNDAQREEENKGLTEKERKVVSSQYSGSDDGQQLLQPSTN